MLNEALTIEAIWTPDTPDKEANDEYCPRTALGRKLMALRYSYIENGGTLFDETKIEAELHIRRGGADAQAHLP